MPIIALFALAATLLALGESQDLLLYKALGCLAIAAAGVTAIRHVRKERTMSDDGKNTILGALNIKVRDGAIGNIAEASDGGVAQSIVHHGSGPAMVLDVSGPGSIGNIARSTGGTAQVIESHGPTHFSRIEIASVCPNAAPGSFVDVRFGVIGK